MDKAKFTLIQKETFVMSQLGTKINKNWNRSRETKWPIQKSRAAFK